ncbi:MAG: enoyl-CoA hydratase/isomerase family protein [Bifidobacteriaceae bacterium]|jgi:enoyl-CoA hydratase|nr:enoyl-CoA hydratase/isomerase family protein [Bifidobacteriaceae bacterium]
MSGAVLHRQVGEVANITINRPEVLNAINRAVLDQLNAVMEELDLRRTRCVVVTGAGPRAFSAGADISGLQRMSRQELSDFSGFGNRVFRRLESLPVPVIAAVNGFALGGGCELALACELRLAAENAVFGLPEVGLGVIPGFGGTQRLAQAVGLGRAKELLYTGRRVSAEEAWRIGLVNAVHPADELAAAAEALAGQIAANGPEAIKAVKLAVDLSTNVDIDTGLRLETELNASCYESDYQREAMRAFVASHGARRRG